MPPTEQSLDDEIAEVEGRLAHHRMQLRVLSAEARSRVNLRAARRGSLRFGTGLEPDFYPV